MTEHRAKNRADVSLEATWDGATGNYDARISDLSEEGCYVDTIGQSGEGEVISLKVVIPDGGTLKVRGVVAHHTATIGFGMKFVDLSEQDREWIRMLTAQ